MGQYLSCLSCKPHNTKVVPLGTLPDAMKHPNSTVVALPRNVSFHRPVQSSLERFSMENSNRSSLATISLGSMQTLSSVKGEITNNDTATADNQESSPSNKRHPGLLTPEPDEDLLNSSLSPGEAAKVSSSSLPRIFGGRQSRVSSFVPRIPTPRPSEVRVIMVKPYQESSGVLVSGGPKSLRTLGTRSAMFTGESAVIPEVPKRVCKHGIPLDGVTRDPHEVNCVRCERPISRGGRALTGMIAFRRAESKQRKTKRLLNKQRLTEEQEKRKKTTEDYDNALRQFAERHQNND